MGSRTFRRISQEKFSSAQALQDAISGRLNPDDMSDIEFIRALEFYRGNNQSAALKIIDRIVADNPGYNPYKRGLLTIETPEGSATGPELARGKRIIQTTTKSALAGLERLYSDRNRGYSRGN